MRTGLIAILIHILASASVAGPRQSVATLFEATFVDDAIPVTGPPQTAQGVIPTGKFSQVSLVSQLTDVTNPLLPGFDVECFFTMTETADPAATLSVRAFGGTITRQGFDYHGNATPQPVLGPFLLCRTGSGGLIASKLTLKAVFTK